MQYGGDGMTRVYLGARGKRSNTPVENRKRAVAYRHVRYRHASEPAAAEAVTETIQQTAPAPEVVRTAAAETKKVKAEPKGLGGKLSSFLYTEKVLSEEEKKNIAAEGMPKTRKERIAEQKEEAVQDLIDTPRSSVVEMLVNPGYAMEKVSMIDDLTISAMSILLINVIKWFAFGWFFASAAKMLINTEAYGFIRMNFTSEVLMAFKICVFCLAAEYLGDFLLSIVSGFMKRPVKAVKITEINGRGGVFTGVLMILSCVLLHFNAGFATALFAAACVTGLMLKGYSMDLFLAMPKTVQIICMLVLTFLFALAGIKFAGFAFADIIELMKTLLTA